MYITLSSTDTKGHKSYP